MPKHIQAYKNIIQNKIKNNLEQDTSRNKEEVDKDIESTDIVQNKENESDLKFVN